MKFDPADHQKSLIELFIPNARHIGFDEACARRALHGCGRSNLEVSIRACLVGMFDVVRDLLPEAYRYLRAAIDRQEVPKYYFPGGTEAARCEELALCEWLIDRRHDRELLVDSVRWQEQWLAGCARPDKMDTQASLPTYLEAEDYETLLRRFELTGLKPAKNLRQIRGPGTMAYTIACHRFGMRYSADEVAAALQSFLKRQVPKWLDEWSFDDAARWMKIAFWEPGDDPFATVLRCYDYLPDLTAPEYHPTAATC